MAKYSGNPDDFTMSFGDHLEELRKRILLALVFPIPISVITFIFSNELINLLLSPLYWVLGQLELPQQVQSLSPPEVLLAKIKISIIGAIIVSLPWLLYQAWRFVRPGLYHHERRFVYFLIPGSAILTTLGVLLMHFVMLPLMLYVLIGIGAGMQQPASGPPTDERAAAAIETIETFAVRRTPPTDPQPGDGWILWPEMTMHVAVATAADDVGAVGANGATTDGADTTDGTNATSPAVEVLMVPQPSRAGIEQVFRMAEYISFVMLLYLAIVLAFQMPLVIVLLGWMGLASESWLREKRKYALLVIGAISAIITPADVISMMAMLIPLYALYELGILLLRFAPASAVAEGRFAMGSGISTEGPRGVPGGPDIKKPGPRPNEKSIPRGDGTDEESTRGNGP